MIADGGSDPLARGWAALGFGKVRTISKVISSSAAETRSSRVVPIRTANPAVKADPQIDPTVPPIPMNPNSRLPCSLRKLSAMKDQKTETTNRLYTLVQMKNTRPSQGSPALERVREST